MRRRGQAVRAAGPIRARPVGRRRAQASTPGGVAGARRTADGAALRPDAARTSTSIRAVTSGTAPLSAEDADAFQREVRHSRPDLLCRNGIRWRCGRLDTGRPPEVLAGQTGQRGPRQPRRPAAGGRRRRQPARPRPAGPARGQAGSARDRPRTGCAPPTWPASTRTASCGSSDAPTRRSSAAASR